MPELGRICVRAPGSALPSGFWAAVAVWVERPQVLNKRLSGSCVKRGQEEEAAVRKLLAELQCPGGDEEVLARIRGCEDGAVTLRSIFPKSGEAGTELLLTDVSGSAVTFVPLEEPSRGRFQVRRNNIYQIRLAHVEGDEWSLSLLTVYADGWESDGVIYPKISWMKNELLSRLAKWSTEDKKSDFKSTLSLIAVDKYSKQYQSLKEKYRDMVKVWPEVTDPEKFVYEDVAIATYLLVLWEEERLQKGLTDKQSFVDLGCGNGLLVHILSNEGYPGRGIDVRRRKIWDMYGPQTVLEESAITPSDNYLFPDTDWIIGNHSDELTPWLPVIAARSSYSCSFFVLPCCFFNFYGKYNRKSSKKPQYREYLDYVTEVGVQCGFIVEEDCLRIPSTKRVCLIGKSRGYSPAEEPQADARRSRYISSHAADSVTHAAASGTCEHNTDSAHDAFTLNSTKHCLQKEPADWIFGFRPRDKVEQVRNCALLPRDFTDKVVLQVAQLLLEEKDKRSTDGGAEQTWNNGRNLPLREVAEVLEKATLQRLKNECGGLQTLLRNNHQVFQVMNSMVSIRDWTQETQTASDKRRTEAKRKLSADALKTRLCWFYINHPDGCPRAAIHCPYAHGTEELRPSCLPKKHRQ
ncbi:probable tRNA (uracil-O(2)-)-methyltransferase [Dendrobates tinctorius]|uniref:probable tRNA (uracil-O(2)-)-methyltransferase n=1 Tax=Dendrobates tinctorius TaxID=92724 RepID=UPI003CCA0006